MSKEKQATVTAPVKKAEEPKKVVLTDRELQIIEELRLRDKKEETLEKSIRLKQLELEAKKEAAKAKKEAEKEKQRVWGNKLVKGIFKYNEIPGGTLEFTFLLHANNKVKKYALKDGMEYTIPRDVAIHLNENGKYLVHAQSVDKDGKPLVTVGRKEDRYSFHSNVFVDISDGKSASLLGPAPQIEVVSFK